MQKVLLVLVLVVAAVPLAAQTQSPSAAQTKVDYEKDVKPILAQNCYGCHGPTAQQSGLRLDLRQNALRGGDYGPVITPGKGAESKLIRRLINGDGGMQMPPSGPLTGDEITTLTAWIDQGAEFRTEIAEEAPPLPVDPKLAAFITAMRSTSRAEVRKAIAAEPELVTGRDHAASTPLHYAAAFGTIDAVTALLEAGADVNAANRRRSTPLHWAIDDEAKVRLLLARGAAVNAKQVEGRTPLFLATSLGSGLPTLRLLIGRGADPNIATLNGQTPLMVAANRGDIEAVRALLDAKADVNAKNGAGETPLMFAAGDGNPQLVRLLLERGADARIRSKRGETALGDAATSGNEETVRVLLDRGAEVNTRNLRGYSPLMLAASSDSVPAGVVKLLLEKGADRSFTADYDENARDLAAKRGNTDVTRLLGGMPMVGEPASMPAHTSMPTRAPIAERVEKALALTEKQSHNFIRTAGCNSCHSQDLPSAVAGFARSRGLNAPREIAQLPASMMPPPERLMDFSVVAVTGIAWELFDWGMNGAPRTAYTDAAARLIRAAQTPAGNWPANESRRPPMNAGEFSATALAIYALKHYTPIGQEKLSEHAIAKAITWLEDAKPATTQDRAFHALALAWAGRSESARASARALLDTQRKDGGWTQLPLMQTDAYATGEALVALSVAGKMSTSDPAFQRGIDYLLRTQASDGSWHVKSRSIWLQPYFESGFPYGQDQFISTAGTAWAAMALSTTMQPSMTTSAAGSRR